MKSFSLDESGEHFQGGGVGPGGGGPQGGGGHYHHHHRDRDNPYGNQGPYDSYQQATPLRQQQQNQHSASAGSVASSGGGGGGGSGSGSGHLYLPSTGGSGSFIRRASATICGSSGVAGQRNMYSHRASNPNVTTAIITGSNSSAHNSQASSYSQSPSSPVQGQMYGHHQQRRLLSARNSCIRMNSVELPDENEKSQSSASASPCPSPFTAQKAQRLLPTNLYVVLYNFKGREADELDLKAGYKVTVIDASDADWWRGKCLGRIGFFPSKYVTKLAPNEKPLQVTHNLQIGGSSGGDSELLDQQQQQQQQNGDDYAQCQPSGVANAPIESQSNVLTKLLRDQIVIQIGEEQNGMVTVRSGDNKQGSCPLQFLQEV